MKVVVLAASYSPVLGGLQTCVSQLVRAWRRQGHEVVVATNRYPRMLAREAVIAGVEVRRFRFYAVCRVDRDPLSFAKWAVTRLPAYLTFHRLLRFLKRERPDVVNLHFLGNQASHGVRACRQLGIPLVVSLHGDDVEGLPRKAPCRLRLFRRVLQEAGHVTACSRYLLSRAVELCPGMEGKASVMPNGLKLETYANISPHRHPKPYLFAGGRFTHDKGFHVLLRAFARMVNEGFDGDLILAGEGPEHGRLTMLGSELGLPVQPCSENSESTSRVWWWGRATPGEMRRLMAGARLVAVPSLRESFGMVALEAVACGRPVIASRVGGLPEIIPSSRDHWLVPPGDVRALARALTDAWNSREPMPRPDLAAFSWDCIVAKYVALFAALPKPGTL